MLRGKKRGRMSAEDKDGDSFNYRRYQRGDVHIVAQIREKGYGYQSAKVADLSRSGCRVITNTFFSPDHPLFITLPGFAPLEARIAWHVRDEYGCEFVAELHEAIFDHIVRQYPAAIRQD
jgi:hypothetical protein